MKIENVQQAVTPVTNIFKKTEEQCEEDLRQKRYAEARNMAKEKNDTRGTNIDRYA